jgi:hypothetical protein
MADSSLRSDDGRAHNVIEAGADDEIDTGDLLGEL